MGKSQPCRISPVDGRGEAQVVPHRSGSAVDTPLLVMQLSATTMEFCFSAPFSLGMFTTRYIIFCYFYVTHCLNIHIIMSYLALYIFLPHVC